METKKKFLDIANPGRLIKIIAKIFYCLEIIGGIVACLLLFMKREYLLLTGLGILGAAVVGGFFIYLIVYAFGDLIENVQRIAEK